jgi:hypothetical protein
MFITGAYCLNELMCSSPIKKFKESRVLGQGLQESSILAVLIFIFDNWGYFFKTD